MDSGNEITQDAMPLPADSGSGTSPFKVIVDIFASPARAFANFNAKPFIILALLLVLALNVVFATLSAPYNAKTQYELMKHSTSLPPGAIDKMKSQMNETHYVSTVVGATFVVLVITAVSALLAWFLGSFFMGGQTTFKKVWGTAILAGMIPAIGNFLKLPLMAAKDSAYVSYGLAALFPDKDFTSILYFFLFIMDAFMVWSIIVAGVGYGAVLGISKGKGVTVSVIVSIVLTALYIGLMAFGMSFAGVKMSFF